MDNPSFAELLRQHRLALGLTQDQLAERAGLSGRAISDLERAVKAPRLSTARLLVRGLGLHKAEAAALLRAAQPQRDRFPDASPDHQRHNLPLSTTSFVERVGELAVLEERLKGNRLVTVTGAGGCGKTRLALELARAYVDHYADGVWLVELASVAEASLVTQTIVTTLGIREDVGRPPVDALTDYLRNRETLLVLDNCEHVIEACVAVIEKLLQVCLHVRLLATSREVLRVAGEAVWRVPSLSLARPESLAGPGRDPVAELLAAEATRLFIDRARLLVPSFVVTEQNALAVARVCQCLDGIPLAIELAAARLPVLDINQLASRLDHHFGLLTGGHRSAAPRQQTLRATIEWSYELLANEERILLRRLAVFAGGWSLEAAEALAGDPILPSEDVLELLSRLVAKSMVLVDEPPKGELGTMRYRLLETIRQFAEEQLLASGEAEIVRTRHRDWYLGLAEQALDGMEGPDQQLWWDLFDAEHSNLVAALSFSAARPDSAHELLRLAGLLGRYWQSRGLARESIQWLEIALARAPAAPNVDRARALNWLGQAQIGSGNVEHVQPVLEQSIAEARAVGDPRLLSMALRHFGQALLFFGRYAEARGLFEEALTLSQAAGPARESAWNLSALGTTLIAEGRPDASEVLLRESIAVGRVSGDDTPVIASLRALGELYRIRGDFARGRQTLGEAVAMARQSKLWSVSLLITLGDLAAAEQDWDAATDCYRQALDLVSRVGLHGTMAYTLRRYAASCVARADYFGAVLIYGATSSTAAAAWALMFAPPSREEDVVNCARQALGEERFAAAWAKGTALSLEQMITQIVREDPESETSDEY